MQGKRREGGEGAVVGKEEEGGEKGGREAGSEGVVVERERNGVLFFFQLFFGVFGRCFELYFWVLWGCVTLDL